MPATEDPRRRLRGYTVLASAATLTAMTAALAAGSPPAQAALSSHRPGVTTPDTTSYITSLRGVSAVSPSDAWAAGYYLNSSNAEVPLTLHWNGTAWAKVKTPAPSGAKNTVLDGVSAVSAADAWAAGYYVTSGGVYEPLIEHWNGTAWATVKSPAPSGAEAPGLNGVSADSAADAWAVGYYRNSGGVSVPLTEHWNGTAWTTVKTPAPTGAEATTLYGVSADSASDAWAAGYYDNSSGVYEPLIEHWNGTAWATVKTPAPTGAEATILFGVSADSSSDAWAAGSYTNSSGVSVPLTEHWNGTAWTTVKIPVPSGENIVLNGVSADSASDAWAAGYYTNSGVAGWLPLILHWNGTAWKQVKSPAPSGATGDYLWGVSADSPSDAWVAGQYINSSDETVTLTQHWNGTAWTTVKSPNGT